MMTGFVLTQLTISIAGFLVLAWNVHKLRQDNYRTDIRRIRDNLFDAMVEGKFAFSTVEYIETRQTLNGMLLMSGSMSTIKFILIGVIHGLYRTTEVPKDDRNISTELREKLRHTKSLAVVRMMEFLFLEGAIGMVCKSLYGIFSLFKLVRRFRGWIFAAGQEMMKDFFYIGDPVFRSSIRLT